jgi:glycosyltransferase involved in cell wall biosynthesis
LAARNVDVTLVLADAKGPFLDDVHPDVKVIDFGAGSVWGALPALARHLRASRPAALLSAMNHANVVAALAHRLARSRARLVLSERAHLSSVLAEFPGLRMRATFALMRLTYPWADRVVTVSADVEQDLRSHLPLELERVVTIYNPVVSEQLKQLAAVPPRHPWLAEGEIPVVLGAGRLIEQKDFSMLLEAFALLRRDRHARLVILGEGASRDTLLAQARRLGVIDHVSLPGFAPNPFAEMRAASVFVLSSRFEGLPGVLVQAMACGTPVVSTDCPGGSREILDDGRWGQLVPVGDARALADAIAVVLDAPQKWDGRTRANDFSVERAVGRYAEVLGLGTA